MTMKQPSNEEFQNNNQNPDGQPGTAPATYSEEEYKNLQAFWTKANQWLIDASKKLAEKSPKELLGMDANIQNKVIKDVWGYDNLDELKVMLPDLLSDDNDEGSNNNNSWDYDDTLAQMKREQELLRMKLSKKEVDDEIEKYTSTNSALTSSVPDFNAKVKEELQYVSSSLSAKERVSRAARLVAGSDIDAEAYLQLQWKSVIKSANAWLTDDYILEAQNKLRKQLWLKQK